MEKFIKDILIPIINSPSKNEFNLQSTVVNSSLQSSLITFSLHVVFIYNRYSLQKVLYTTPNQKSTKSEYILRTKRLLSQNIFT